MGEKGQRHREKENARHGDTGTFSETHAHTHTHTLGLPRTLSLALSLRSAYDGRPFKLPLSPLCTSPTTPSLSPQISSLSLSPFHFKSLRTGDKLRLRRRGKTK